MPTSSPLFPQLAHPPKSPELIELEQLCEEGLRRGMFMAALIGGEVLWFAPQHFPGDCKPLTVQEVAEAAGWEWWFQQN